MPFPLNYHFECIPKLFEIGTRTSTKQNEERKKNLNLKKGNKQKHNIEALRWAFKNLSVFKTNVNFTAHKGIQSTQNNTNTLNT